ncbi:MAG: MarR family winged helix-turn-helix transcriptional regulator [Nocardioidaceae bacterium]
MTPRPRTVMPHAPALTSLTGYLLRRAYAMTVDCARSSLDENANLRDVGILTILRERGPMSQRAVADLLQINPTIMVKLVDALESRGYLVRERNPDDRRAYALTITAEGERRREELLGEFDRSEEALTERLSDAERTRLNTRLRRLLQDDALAILPSLLEYTGYLIALAHQQQLGRTRSLLEPLGIQPREFGVMSAIEREDPCSQQHVAELLGVSPPIVLWLIDGLERDELVRRTRNPDDRRSYDLTLTPAGQAKLETAIEVVGSVQEGIVERLGARGDRELRRLLLSIVGD